ncbi:MAG: lipid-A-disaccharide synthase [Planctomycetota bacterium]
MAHLFLSAGDASGVAIGAQLMRTLKERLPGVTFAGLGGPAMVEEGMRLLYDPASYSAMWLWGNLRRVPEHIKVLRRCEEDWERQRPDAVIAIDYQAFHLFLGTRARARGLPVVHFVGSQFWGRRYWTLEPARRAYSHVLLIHEFEKPYYDAAKIPATYVGYPMFERLRQESLDPELIGRLRRLPSPRLALLPGSRRLEIKSSLPLMLEVARGLEPRPYLLVSEGHPQKGRRVRRTVARSGLEGEVFSGSLGEILSAADLALVTSGSATMEAVYHGCPSVILYRIHPFSYFIAKPHIVGFFAKPNLIAGREIVPEFLLGSFNPRPVAEQARRLLRDASAREEQRRDFAALKERLLGGPVPSQAAADVVVRTLRQAAAP